MKRLLTLLIILSSCSPDEEIIKEPNTICIYTKTVSTSAQSPGKYELVLCSEDLYLRPKYYTLAIDCNCPERP